MEASPGPTTGVTPNGHEPDERSLGEVVTQISETASTLVREEIELAKAEIEQKIRRLATGAVVAVAGGFFVLLALIFIFHTLAWGLSDAFFPDSIWLGFLVTAGFLLLLAGVAGFVAYRSFSKGASPVPDQAIEEAKLIKEALEHPEVQAAVATSETGEE